MAESFSREKLRHAPQKKVDEKSYVTPAGTPNELDIQNEWEEHTHTTHMNWSMVICQGSTRSELP